MKDIARLAQVSTSTVSHVINDSRFVSEEIRHKVLNVVEQLNYQPSALARSLKIKQTKTIGMLVSANDNPFFAEVVNAVENYCHQNDYQLILSNTAGDSQRLHKNLQLLLQKQVDGLLLMAADEFSTQSVHLPVPTVVMDWWPTPLAVDQIYGDSIKGGYFATQALIEQGHQNIAIITGDLRKPLARNRLQGYHQAMKQAGLAIFNEWIIESDFSFAGGVAGMQKLLALHHKPTAIFACSDTIAVGAYQVAGQNGLRIPQDISIIGYDDIQLAQYLYPPLSTIHQPKKEFGRLAVETLLARIKHPDLPIQPITIEPHLVLRQSIRTIK